MFSWCYCFFHWFLVVFPSVFLFLVGFWGCFVGVLLNLMFGLVLLFVALRISLWWVYSVCFANVHCLEQFPGRLKHIQVPD